jgi:hypothetical protein
VAELPGNVFALLNNSMRLRLFTLQTEMEK